MTAKQEKCIVVAVGLRLTKGSKATMNNLHIAQDYFEQAEKARLAGDRSRASILYGNASSFFMQVDPYGKPGTGLARAQMCQCVRSNMWAK